MRTRAWRLVSAGIVVALAVGMSGRIVERVRFGAADAETLARVEAQLRGRFDADAAMLAGVPARVASVVVEQSLADPQPTPAAADTAIVPTSIVPVIVHTPFSTRDGVPEPPLTDNFTFNVLAPSGGVLVDAEVSRQDVSFVRS